MNWDLDDSYQRYFRHRLWNSVVKDKDVEVFLTDYLRQRLYWNLFPTVTTEVNLNSIVTKFAELSVLSKLEVFLCFPYVEHMKNRRSASEIIKLSNTIFVGIDEFVPLLTEECRLNITNSEDGPEMMLIKIRHLEAICTSRQMKHYLPLSYIEAAEEVRTGLNNMILQLFDDVNVMKTFEGTTIEVPEFVRFLLRFKKASFRERAELIFTSENVGIFKRAPKIVIKEDPPLKHLIKEDPPLKYVIKEDPPLKCVIKECPPLKHVIKEDPPLKYVIKKDPPLKYVTKADPPSKTRDSVIEVNIEGPEKQITYERLFEIMKEQEEEHYDRMNAQLSLTPINDVKQEKQSFRQLEVMDPKHPYNKLSQRKHYDMLARKTKLTENPYVRKLRQYKNLEIDLPTATEPSQVCDDPSEFPQQEKQTQPVFTDLRQLTNISENEIIPGSYESSSLQNVNKQQLEMQHNQSNFQRSRQNCSEVKHQNFMNSNQKEVDQTQNQLVFSQFSQSHEIPQQSRRSAAGRYRNIVPVLNRNGTPFCGINTHQPLFYETRFDAISRTYKKVYFFGSIDLLSKLRRRHPKPNPKKVASATIKPNNDSYINGSSVRTNNPKYVNLAIPNSHISDEVTHSAVGNNTNKVAPVKNIRNIKLDDFDLDGFEMDPMAIIDHEEVVSTTEDEQSDFVMDAEGNVEQQALQTKFMFDSTESDYQTFNRGIFETRQPSQTEFLYGHDQETTSSSMFSVVDPCGSYSELVHTKNNEIGPFTMDFDTDELDDEMETVDIEEIPDNGDILFEEPKMDDLFFSADEIEGLLTRKKVTEQATSSVTKEEYARLEEDYPDLLCQSGLNEESRKIMAAFLLGRQKNPQPSLGYFFSVKMNETIQFRPKSRIEVLFEMNFRFSTWRRLRKTFTYEGNDIVEVNEYLDGPKNRTEYLHFRNGPSFESVKF